MAWRSPERDPNKDPAASDVMAAYNAAVAAQSSTEDCYRAGVQAWRRAHPDQTAEYAAKQAVAVILTYKAKSLLRPD